MTTTHSLGDLQSAIMNVLWARGEATSAEVHAALRPERGLAPTTIATMLAKMEKKGVVRHRTEGRRFIYQPAVTAEQVKRSMVSDLVDRLFDGDATAMLSHLISRHEIDPEELPKLKALIERRERQSEE